MTRSRIKRSQNFPKVAQKIAKDILTIKNAISHPILWLLVQENLSPKAFKSGHTDWDVVVVAHLVEGPVSIPEALSLDPFVVNQIHISASWKLGIFHRIDKSKKRGWLYSYKKFRAVFNLTVTMLLSHWNFERLFCAFMVLDLSNFNKNVKWRKCQLS